MAHVRAAAASFAAFSAVFSAPSLAPSLAFSAALAGSPSRRRPRLPHLAIATLLATAALAAPAAALTPAPLPSLQGEALARALEGAWCNSEDGGLTCWAYDVFSADGQLRACGRFPDDDEAFEGVGEVTVSGDRMCYRVLRASENFWLPPEGRYCSRITGISPQAHDYQDTATGPTIRLHRIPLTAVTCPAIRR